LFQKVLDRRKFFGHYGASNVVLYVAPHARQIVSVGLEFLHKLRA